MKILRRISGVRVSDVDRSEIITGLHHDINEQDICSTHLEGAIGRLLSHCHP